jgi:hypothetical protein
VFYGSTFRVSCIEPSGRERASDKSVFFSTCAFYLHSGEMKCVKRGGRKSKLTAREGFSAPRGQIVARLARH